MTSNIQKHLWADIANAPAVSGVYAWYYSPEITEFDLERTILAARTAADRSDGEDAVRSLMDDRIFRYFREEPYNAELSGPLKAAFSGKLDHNATVSHSIVSRLADDPERLRAIKNVLALSAPMFASPLYIGMAAVLRTRLARHKDLIEKYRSAAPRDGQVSRSSDAGFAWQIAKRKIPPERLFVFTCSIAGDDGTAVDVENILNRICYPILGRN